MWVDQWVAFVKDQRAPIPGRVSNERLLGDGQPIPFTKLKSGLKIVTDYRCLTQEVWEIYIALYGGGPVITAPYRHRKNPDAGTWVVQLDEGDKMVLQKPKRRSSFKRMMAAADAMKGFMEPASIWLHGEGNTEATQTKKHQKPADGAMADVI